MEIIGGGIGVTLGSNEYGTIYAVMSDGAQPASCVVEREQLGGEFQRRVADPLCLHGRSAAGDANAG